MNTYKVWDPEDGDEDLARKVDARSSAKAVERWAEWRDAYSAEYEIVRGGEPVTVHCRLDAPLSPREMLLDNARPLEVFEVDGESVPVYRARRTAIVK